MGTGAHQHQLYLVRDACNGRRSTTVSTSAPSVPLKRLTDVGADYFGWADDGKTITWAVGASYFRQPLSSISFEPPKDEKKEGEKKDGDAKDADKKDDKKDDKKEEKKPRNSRSRKRTFRKLRLTWKSRARLPKERSSCAVRLW